MKLEFTVINNFQSHKNTEISFHPGVNVIVGRSDVGKSSILRAINWALTNRPSGEAFISNWESDSTDVRLGFEDQTIARIKEKGFNGYRFDEQDFKGFGLAIPKEISDFLNMDEINMQTQFDSPFMLSWTAGERGAFLNKIVDLEITDKTIGNIKSNILSERRYVTGLEDDIKELEEELEQYEFLDQYESDLIQLEKTQEEHEDIHEKNSRLVSLLAEEKIRRDEIEALSHIPKLFRMVSETEIDLSNLKSSQENNKGLKRIIDSAKQYTKTCESLKDVANSARSIDKIGIDIIEYKNVREKRSKLDLLIKKDIDYYECQIRKTQKALKEEKKEFEKLIGDKCPLCNRPIGISDQLQGFHIDD